MTFREANVNDIKQIQYVRNAVKENRLSNPDLVSDLDCEIYMTSRGKAWVCAMDLIVVGFAYVDLKEHNIWALFVLPEKENMGIGKELLRIMLDWYFSFNDQTIWLSTSPDTRAALFYKMQGWEEMGNYGKEIKFEMTLNMWKNKMANSSL